MSSVALPSMRWPSKRDLRRAVLHHAADRAQGRGLAGAVGAEDGGDPARLHREADAVQDPGRAVLRLQVLDLEDSGPASASSLPR